MLVLTAVLAAAAFGQKKDELIPAVPTDLATAAYPFVAIESGVSGTIIVQVRVNKTGTVDSVISISGPNHVCSNSRRPEIVALRSAAYEAAMKTQYTPAKRNKRSVESTATLRFDFVPPSSSDPTTVNRNANSIEVKRAGAPIEREISASTVDGLTGTAEITYITDVDGSMYVAIAASGHPKLKAAAVSAACSEILGPTVVNGQPVRITGILRYKFIP